MSPQIGDHVRITTGAAAGYVGVLDALDNQTPSWALVRFPGWQWGDACRWYPLADLERFAAESVVRQPMLPGISSSCDVFEVEEVQ